MQSGVEINIVALLVSDSILLDIVDQTDQRILIALGNRVYLVCEVLICLDVVVLV